MRRTLRRSLVVLSLLVAGAPSPAGAAYTDDAVKAAFLYRFTGYVDWPQSSLQGGEFTVAVLEAPPVARELGRLLARYPVKQLPARVRVIDDVAQAAGAHVLYVGRGYQGDLQDVVRELAAQPVLLVTDRAGALDDGSVVNFLLVDRRVRFEVSLGAAQRAGLKVSSQLLAVAARVRGAVMPWPLRPCPQSGPPTNSFDRSCRVRVAMR
ncbi:MAG TPA: YfiR family protein [Steroidobacteraceae bacterium]|nr:YfiR family protein [Steroidobacteraceae bacterium]